VREIFKLDVKPLCHITALREDGDSPPERFVNIDLNTDTHEAAPASP
jgi:hypothetical protein